MTTTGEYWQERAIRRSAALDRHIDAKAPHIARIYALATRAIERDLEAVYRKYSDATGVDITKLRELMSRGETDAFWRTQQGKLDAQYIKANYKARINRLEALKHQIYAHAQTVAQPQMELATAAHAQTIKFSYLHTAYDAERTLGSTPQFSQINTQRLNRMLSEQWHGANYSQRIWGNTDILASDISERLTAGLLAGKSPQVLARELRERMGAEQHNAMRLIRTETTYFENEAEALLYQQMGVKEYVYMATLDTRTSIVCGSLDGKRFKLSERQQGVNYPPMHPNCRSKVRAWLGDDREPELRRRRTAPNGYDPDADHSAVSGYQSYGDWVKTHGAETLAAKPTVPTRSLAIGDIIGTRGEPMTPDEALEANPNYKASRSYQVNCQRCVPTYELRRRGYNVEALPRTRTLARLYNGALPDMEELWQKQAELKGYIPRAGKRAYRLKYAEMVAHAQQQPVGARLQVFYHYTKRKSGHTVIAERVRRSAKYPDGLRFLDPQNGKQYAVSPHKDIANAWGYIRVDNAKPKQDLLRFITTKADRPRPKRKPTKKIGATP